MATDCSSKQQKVIIVSSFKALLLLITFTLKMKFCSFFVACLTVTTVSSFTLNEGNNKFKLLTGTTSTTDKQGCSPEHQPTRADFVRQSAMTVAVTAIGSSIFGVEPAIARGRATLEFAYEKYTPRIEAGGVFYKNKLKTLIANNDFAGIKRALQEPPKKRHVFFLN